MAYEKLLTLCLQQVIQRNALLEASSSPSPTAAATEWKFQDINGSLNPVHAYITPVLDEFDKLFKGATDTFMAPDLSDVYLLTQMLQSGEIVPLRYLNTPSPCHFALRMARSDAVIPCPPRS